MDSETFATFSVFFSHFLGSCRRLPVRIFLVRSHRSSWHACSIGLQARCQVGWQAHRAQDITCRLAFQAPLSVLICMCWLVRLADACGMHSLTTVLLTVTDTSSSVRRSRLVRVPIQPPPSSGSAVSGWPVTESTLWHGSGVQITLFLSGLNVMPMQLACSATGQHLQMMTPCPS